MISLGDKARLKLNEKRIERDLPVLPQACNLLELNEKRIERGWIRDWLSNLQNAFDSMKRGLKGWDLLHSRHKLSELNEKRIERFRRQGFQSILW
ncbi:MAG: hypothetical protein DRO09_01510 [Thermoprotei archaeon]|nr:MAG: hypothetical protein DRO09_01510 [Thermoprotei archaeon]